LQQKPTRNTQIKFAYYPEEREIDARYCTGGITINQFVQVPDENTVRTNRDVSIENGATGYPIGLKKPLTTVLP